MRFVHHPRSRGEGAVWQALQKQEGLGWLRRHCLGPAEGHRIGKVLAAEAGGAPGAASVALYAP